MMERDEFLSRYTQHLNEKQLMAVQTVDGPVLLLAVPGSGKTTVLVNRLGYMLYVAGIAPENILTLTYTVAATNDMSRRFESVFGADYAGRLEFRTINGICARVISRYGRMIGREPFKLLSDERSAGRILTDILIKHLPEYPTESDVSGAGTLISYCKNMLLDDSEIKKLGDEQGVPLLDIYKDYNAYLKAERLMDYDDQMVYAYRMLKNLPDLLQLYREKYRYICVDEAQDTSKIQHIIIDMLAGADGNLFMVGDEDQSIYGFRAAYPEALLSFEQNHPNARVLVMDQNYRSAPEIVSAADVFIRHNVRRHDKHMVAVRNAGSDIRFIELKFRAGQYGYLEKVAEECRAETAVLYRNNESVIPLIDRLDRRGISFRLKSIDMAFFTHRVVLDVTNIMRLSLDPYDTELFMRVYFKCQTYLRKNQAELLCKVSRKKNIPVLEAIQYVSGLNGMVLGKCRALATNLRIMRKETASKALFRIEKTCGYGEYLEQNGLDGNKLYVLKQLAYNERTVESFLGRLEYLRDKLKNSTPDYSCPFILSTIHSSKGLEYDRVFLMDVCDGVFPAQVAGAKKNASPQDEKLYEEERRLFYVGMTRAKNNLNIFKLEGSKSSFLKELAPVDAGRKASFEKSFASVDAGRRSSFEKETASGDMGRMPGAADKKRMRQNGAQSVTMNRGAGPYGKRPKKVSYRELIIGERVVSEQYGPGVVNDVEYDSWGEEGYSGRFTVLFDSGDERTFMYPLAFWKGMWREEG